jgi:hypothetical protein
MKATTATVGIDSLTPVFDRAGVLLHSLETNPKKRSKSALSHEMAGLVEHIAQTCEKAYVELEESLVMLAREKSL